MRIPRIFQSLNLSVGETLELDENGFNHLIRVLRMKSGQQIELFNGEGNSFLASLTDVEKKRAYAQVDELIASTPKPVLNIHLGQVLSKGDRFDYAIQKSVELGVSEITPLFSSRCDLKLPSNRIDKKMEHWQKIVISACEQCQQNWLPRLNPPLELNDWISTIESGLKLVLDAQQDQSLSKLDTPEEVTLLVGPEGGLTDEEITSAKNSGFTGIRLGPRILRTETAPVAALSLVQYLWGDFK